MTLYVGEGPSRRTFQIFDPDPWPTSLQRDLKSGRSNYQDLLLYEHVWNFRSQLKNQMSLVFLFFVFSEIHSTKSKCRTGFQIYYQFRRFITDYENELTDLPTIVILYRVKPQANGGILRIRGLRQGDSQVQPHILGMSPTLGLYCKAQSKIIMNQTYQTYVDHEVQE